ncbi:MAG: chemotaxis protein CheW [Candidatus Eisenbacteria bacterium]|uniref:Chemotaxis protein CheW n=1 Tax=Eiseniibacteriota bacterium TaxID=2212470 RepID=A0A956SGD5_UNCEI|nr:chemotaxis protein CheW [Candidatus Eisenbacteria bacterium]
MSSTRSSAGKFLSFTLGTEAYALEIMKVKEITANTDVTHVPNVPDYFRGVINLHGSILPVIDLRKKFGLPFAEDTPQTCIIVVQHDRGGVSRVVGLVVDSVSEFVDLSNEDIEATPNFGAGIDTRFIRAMAKRDGLVITLLDVDNVLADAEIETETSEAA